MRWVVVLFPEICACVAIGILIHYCYRRWPYRRSALRWVVAFFAGVICAWMISFGILMWRWDRSMDDWREEENFGALSDYALDCEPRWVREQLERLESGENGSGRSHGPWGGVNPMPAVAFANADATTDRACLETLRILLDAGGDPNTVLDSGETLLSLAIGSGRSREFVALLVESGADPCAPTADSEGVPPSAVHLLDLARESNDEAMVSLVEDLISRCD